MTAFLFGIDLGFKADKCFRQDTLNEHTFTTLSRTLLVQKFLCVQLLTIPVWLELKRQYGPGHVAVAVAAEASHLTDPSTRERGRGRHISEFHAGLVY